FGSFPASRRPVRSVPPPPLPARAAERVVDRFAALGRIHRAWLGPAALGDEVHVAVDLRSGADPAVVRAMLDELCRAGLDERSIERAVTRREAGAIWGLTGLARRASLIQRHMLYRHEPDGLAAELARYRAVTPATIDAAVAHWLDPAAMVEVETVAAA